MCSLQANGISAFVGLPEREALKLQDLWNRGEIGVELSVEVRAPVVVGIYPMRIARYVMGGNGNGAHGYAPPTSTGPIDSNGLRVTNDSPPPRGAGAANAGSTVGH